MIAHSDKQDAAPTWQKVFGCTPDRAWTLTGCLSHAPTGMARPCASSWQPAPIPSPRRQPRSAGSGPCCATAPIPTKTSPQATHRGDAHSAGTKTAAATATRQSRRPPGGETSRPGRSRTAIVPAAADRKPRRRQGVDSTRLGRRRSDAASQEESLAGDSPRPALAYQRKVVREVTAEVTDFLQDGDRGVPSHLHRANDV